jgi:glutamate-1-semialdehyde 2,1-aminomutase
MADSANEFSKRLNRSIPGGAHTYSRGDDQFPENAPAILERGEGCYVYDPAGNKYLDYGMALRAVTLGYSDKEVNKAAFEAIEKGNNLTRASLVELNAAELLTDLIPNAEMVKFAKNGSTVTSAAVKLARAYTGKKYIVRCLDHPFFSYDDWFIGDTVIKRGIPDEISTLTLNFKYNDSASLEKLFNAYKGQVACVIMEPAASAEPATGFLNRVKELCHSNGALFILDEMITGFRFHLQGCQKLFGIDADLITFGKGMANGFSVSALTGKREIMELGSINTEGAERVFLISTTHGAEMCGLAAFIKTVEIYKRENVVDHLWEYGKKLMDGMNSIARDLEISDCFSVEGFPCSPNYITKDKNNNISLGLRTLFSQEMIRNNVLMPWIALSMAHGDKELELTLSATRKALKVYTMALKDGYEKYLTGKAIKPVFRSHN